MLLVNKNIREQATWTEFEKNIRQSRYTLSKTGNEKVNDSRTHPQAKHNTFDIDRESW